MILPFIFFSFVGVVEVGLFFSLVCCLVVGRVVIGRTGKRCEDVKMVRWVGNGDGIGWGIYMCRYSGWR